MNCISARSSRASSPFSTTKRAPDSLRGGLEIHHAERFADLVMLLAAEGVRKVRLLAEAADLDIVVLVLAVRHVVERDVGNFEQRFLKRLDGSLLRRLQAA